MTFQRLSNLKVQMLKGEEEVKDFYYYSQVQRKRGSERYENQSLKHFCFSIKLPVLRRREEVVIAISLELNRVHENDRLLTLTTQRREMKWKGEIRIPKVQTFLQVDNTC